MFSMCLFFRKICSFLEGGGGLWVDIMDINFGFFICFLGFKFREVKVCIFRVRGGLVV